jgi:hypothetical protein
MGRRRWKKESGDHRQARVENTFFRYKSVTGADSRRVIPNRRKLKRCSRAPSRIGCPNWADQSSSRLAADGDPLNLGKDATFRIHAPTLDVRGDLAGEIKSDSRVWLPVPCSTRSPSPR